MLLVDAFGISVETIRFQHHLVLEPITLLILDKLDNPDAAVIDALHLAEILSKIFLLFYVKKIGVPQ